VERPENLGVLALAHFRKRTAKQWHSSMIDLSLEEIEIRKNLNGKWRNQLKKAKKSNIKIKNDNSVVSLSWLLDRYKQMMKDKSFKGPSVELYIDLHSLNKNNLYVFQAWLDGQVVAGILIVRHGTSCTYQIGWNSPIGRKVHSNNLLLWNAILKMKQHGCIFFDMGGIDTVNTPGIAKFKHGLGGEEYTLIGEWIGV
jgi:lipid II:glycine glycyltransferase (peptidoglycan interpeptide bridge formation enzyme)